MSITNKLKNGLEEETKCQICTGLIDDPHTLFCGHSFCGVCCLNWFKTNKNCPTCRTAAVRQPVHSIALQKISDLLRAEGTIRERKLTRADWLDFYPVENQSTNYIRDVDQDGVIHRCSNCGWELDEEDFCAQCLIQYEGGSNNGDNGYDMTMSDAEEGSNHEDEEDLDDFVVDDGQVEFESSVHGDHILDDDEPILLDSDEEERPNANRRSRKRRRIRHDSSDDEDLVQANSSDSNQSDESEEDSDNDSNNYGGTRASRRVIALDNEEEEEESEEEEEEEEYADDPFDRHPVRNQYIDDYASEDDEEEEEFKPRAPKPDHVRDTIANAQAQMKRAQKAANSAIAAATSILTEIQDSSSSSSDDSDDVEADYAL